MERDEMSEYFSGYTCPADYEEAGLIPIEPMTAKEIMDKDREEVMTSPKFIFEQKLDGIRGLIYFMPETDSLPSHCRVFSRRVSKKTKYYSEKSDSIPHVRDICIPELEGTVLDCEMTIPHQGFKEVSSILNCLPTEAISRQIIVGKVVCNVFDCIYYKGEDISHKTLSERKVYLMEVMRVLKENGITCIREVPYSDSTMTVSMSAVKYLKLLTNVKGKPNFSKLEFALEMQTNYCDARFITPMEKEVYFEYIVACGGEGIMLKDIDSIYEQKRTRAYQKVKKRVYRDVVITGYTEPTREYNGKLPKDYWEFWESADGNKVSVSKTQSAKGMIAQGYTPVTKNYFYDLIGGIEFGVVEDKYFPVSKARTSKKFVKRNVKREIDKSIPPLIVVGECEGIDDEMRLEISKNREEYLMKVFEVEGNEIFEDTGKIRHPRFYRWREDKEPIQCLWKDHMNM